MQNLKLNKSNSPVLISALLFILFASFSVIYYSVASRAAEENAKNIFAGEVDRINNELTNSMSFYGSMLHSMKGLFEASEVVSAEEFKKFTSGISISTEYSPILSFTYIEKIESVEVASSATPRSDRYVVKYSEPQNEFNEKLIGMDFSARYPGAVKEALTIDGPVATEIFVDPYLNMNEVMVILPVYKEGSSEVVIDGREQNISGFVSLSFRTKDLFDDIFSPGSTNRLLITDIFEENQTNPEALIYSNSIYPASYLPEHVFIQTKEFANKNWTIRFSSTENFSKSVGQGNKIIYIVIAGLLISILLAATAYFILTSRSRALKLAEIMTKDLGEDEKKLRKLNRALLTISEANQVVVKEKDEQKLLDSVCNILIKIAGYQLVWIGYAEHDEAKTLRVASWAGHSDGYVEKLRVTWSNSDPRGRGPAGRAIREGKTIVESDFSEDPNFDPWREDAEIRGYKGGIFIPLTSRNKLLGSLNIYSSEKNVFSKEEIEMLEELAADVAFSISSVRVQSEKEATEKALKESEELMSQYMKNSPIYTFIKEVTPTDIKVLKASANYPEMIGSKGENIEGKTMKDLFPADFAAKIEADDRSVMESGKVLKIDEDFDGKNYTTIKFPVVIGKKRFLAGYTIDITDRKKNELVIEENERRFRNYFELPLVGRAVTSPEKGWLEVNQKLCDMLGYTREELIHKTWEEVTYPEDLAPDLKQFNRVLAGEIDDYTLEKRFIHKKGHIVYTNLSIQAVRNTDGSLNYIIALLFDITDKKIAEQELIKRMEELQQFRLAVDNASDHIIITDPDAKILYANKGVSKITGYSKEELIGSTPALWGGQMPKAFYENMWRTIKVEKKSFVGELTNKRKDGQLYEAEFSVSPILNDAGEIIYFVGVERDVTTAKKIEKSKNEFVSLASHQLRTPLTAINWYAEMLLSGDAGKLNDKQLEYVSELEGSSRRMTDLVSALLNVSRIDLGTFTINPKPTDIIKISKGVLKDLFIKISDKKIKIIEEYEKLPEINADPNLVTIILQNLVTNAVKYTPELGTVKIGIKEEGEYVLIAVEDNGYGIPLYQQDRIFQKFFRADNIVPVETDGNGLGLYMVKQIVDSAGGSISFTSKEGEGTIFIVKIPSSGMKRREGTRILEQKGFGI